MTIKKPSISNHKNQIFTKALEFHRAGKLDDAEKLYKKLLLSIPFNSVLLTNLATLTFQKGDFENTIKLIDQSLIITPNQPNALNTQGNALQNLNRLEQAIDSYDKAITMNPYYAEAYSNRGVALQKLNYLNQAIASFDKAISINPFYAEAYCNRGNAFQYLKCLDEAIASYDQAIAINPHIPEAHSNRGSALQNLKRHNQALQSFNQAIAINPNYAEAYSNRGISLENLNRLDEALASYNQAIAINPNYAEAYSNRGNVLTTLNRLNEAIISYDQAIIINPNYAEAYCNRGNALKNLKQLSEAEFNYDKAIAINPNYAQAYWNKAFIKLLNGDYLDGWRLYEWRWKKQPLINSVRHYPQPLWLGKPSINGKTLLIYPEQGYGDFIQFIRYAKLVEQLGALIIFELPYELIAITSSLKCQFSIIEKGKTLPKFDYHCPIMSLPLAFETTLETIPNQIPYLYADINKKKQWQHQLGNKNTRRIGLVWSGSRNHKNNLNRSISFNSLNTLFKLPIEFHCLQKEISADDEITITKNRNISLHTHLINDFSDTAALIEEMDLIISVDTSVAHLAGALGKELWLLLPYAPDYRWMLDRDDTPWYPTAKLFRQSKTANWEYLINQIRDELLKKLSNH
ncbi:MAG: hypothetical protein RLZ92_1285 [Pseudomonadota bacterium]